ncbi:MAG: hypothetical protein IH840_07935, partial [Candidatus Heimdallarchaeota archaeon]|nr:hypothetical protein [Candidatus Heimdallarchaeota archaeon]
MGITKITSISFLLILVFLVQSILVPAEIVNQVDQEVSVDSNVDNIPSKGELGGTATSNAQSLDGSYQKISEFNNSESTVIVQTPNNFATNIDSVSSQGDITDFANLSTKDGQIASFSENPITKIWGDNINHSDIDIILSNATCMGGNSPNIQNMNINSVNIYLNGSGSVRLGIYQGGDLVTGPPTANLVWDAGLIIAPGIDSWQTIPISDIQLNASLATWICWKANDESVSVYFRTTSNTDDDFQDSRGSFISDTESSDETVAWSSNFPASGSFDTRYYSIYLTYDLPERLDQELAFDGAINFASSLNLAIYTNLVGNEQINVSMWNGSGWDLIGTDFIANSWNNFTINVTSPTLIIRFFTSGDGILDLWEFDLIAVTFWGNVGKDLYISQPSNKDNLEDRGTHSNFSTLMSDDGGFDTLTESINASVINESFENEFPPTGWSALKWEVTSDQAFDGSYSAEFTGSGNRQLTTVNIDASNSSAIFVDFYWYDLGIGANQFILKYFDGNVYDTIVDLNTVISPDGWHHYLENITDSQYLVDNFKIRWTITPAASGSTVGALDLIRVTLQEDVAKLDLEVEFTDIPFSAPSSVLRIHTGNLATETLGVEYWTGSSWSVLTSTLIANSWNNFTVSTFVNSYNFSIRLIDGNRSNDDTINIWQIGSILLNFEISATHYQLDWEHQTQNVEANKEEYRLTIFGYSSNVSEQFYVQIWNPQTSSWEPTALTISNTEQWYNVTITRDLIQNAQLTWRYTGSLDNIADGNDLKQSTLLIDYSGVASFNEVPIILIPPPDITYSEGTIDNILVWTVTDQNPGTYTVERNESNTGISGSWMDQQEITVNVDGLAAGIYNYTIILLDAFNTTLADSVLVTVEDTTPPSFLQLPLDLIFNEGVAGVTLSWTLIDLHPQGYEVLRNGTSTKSGNWISAEAIIVDLEGLSPFVYNYTIIVMDESNNVVVDTVFVEILEVIFISVDTFQPQIILETKVFEGYIDQIAGSWVDVSNQTVPFGNVSAVLSEDLLGVNVLKTQITTVFDGSFFMGFDYTGILPGSYFLIFEFNQPGYQNQTVNFSVSVLAHQLSIEIDLTGELIQNQDFVFEIRVVYNDTQAALLGLNQIGGKTGGVEGITVTASLELEYQNGTLKTLDLRVITDNDGYAIMTVFANQTANLSTILVISAAAESSTIAVENVET